MDYYSAMRKEDISVICDNMDGPQACFAKWQMSDKDKHCVISLICGILKGQTCENRVKWYLPGVGGKEDKEMFKGTNLKRIVNKP